MFASKSVAEHLLRGAVGLGAFAAAVVVAPEHPWWAVGLVPIALVALRGCPTCWTIGLIQTLAGRKDACTDGACAQRGGTE